MTRYIDATPAQRWFQYEKAHCEKQLAAMPGLKADLRQRLRAAREKHLADLANSRFRRRVKSLIQEVYRLGEHEVSLLTQLENGRRRFETEARS
jgi:hypothetical protein